MKRIGKQQLNGFSLLVLAMLLSASAGLATGCLFREKALPTVTIDRQPDRQYLTLNELIQDAEVIARVKVLSSETTDNRAVELDESAIVTLAKVEIIRSYKGSLAEDTEILVLETGGLVEQDDQSVDIQVNGISVMKPEESFILFLQSVSGSGEQQVYEPVGLYQGKFRIEKNLVQQQAPDAEKLTDHTPLSVDVFSAEIMAAVIGQRITY